MARQHSSKPSAIKSTKTVKEAARRIAERAQERVDDHDLPDQPSLEGYVVEEIFPRDPRA